MKPAFVLDVKNKKLSRVYLFIVQLIFVGELDGFPISTYLFSKAVKVLLAENIKALTVVEAPL